MNLRIASFFALLLTGSMALRMNGKRQQTSKSAGELHVIFGIQTCAIPANVKSLEAQLATWASNVPREDIVVIAGPHDDHLEGHAKDANPCEDRNQDCKEGLLLYRAAQKVRATGADWFISIQEDQYVKVDELKASLSKFDADKHEVLAQHGCGQGWDEAKGPKPASYQQPEYSCPSVWTKGGICNGLGSVYSRSALIKLVKEGQTQEDFMKEYMLESKTDVFGRSDMTTSCLLNKRGIDYFAHQLPYSWGNVDMNDAKNTPDVLRQSHAQSVVTHVAGAKEKVPDALEVLHAGHKASIIQLVQGSGLFFGSGVQVSTCGLSFQVPNPYSPSYLKKLYHDDGLVWNGVTKNMTDIMQTWSSSSTSLVQTVASDCSALQAVDRLLQDGLELQTFGVDLRQVQKKRYGLPSTGGQTISDDPDVHVLRKMYFPTKIDDFFFQKDVPNWYLPFDGGLNEKDNKLLQVLKRDGAVSIDRWDLDVDSFVNECKYRLAHQSKESLKEKPVATNEIGRIPEALKHLLTDKDSVPYKLARGYLGADAVWHDLFMFTLDGNWQNSPFHHDGCGTRLKMMFFIDDVDEETFPTQVVAGTNRNYWYGPTQFFIGPATIGHNKLEPSAVQKEYAGRIQSQTGKQGGGFIFDTNAIHGAKFKGSKPRTVLIAEFADKKKWEGEIPNNPIRKDDHSPSVGFHGICPGV